MKITVRRLRQLIREFGVDDTMRHEAGFGDTGGVSSAHRDREAILNPPPGLGDAEHQEDELDTDKVQKKSQLQARVDDAHGGPWKKHR